MLGLFVVFLLAYHVSQTAFDSGRSRWAWGLGAVGIFYGSQFLATFFLGIFWVIMYGDEELPNWIVLTVGLSVSIVAYILFYRYVNKLPDKSNHASDRIHEIGREEN